MSSLLSIQNSALSSLEANQSAMSLISNNIANSNNPNYSQQNLIMTPSPEGGVQVLGVEGVRDNLLNQRVIQQSSSQSSADTLSTALGNVQPLFSDNAANGGLLQDITNFFDSFQTLATNPTSSSFQQQVQSSAENLVNGFQQLSSNLTEQQSQADQSIAPAVQQINSLAGQIASINQQIMQAGADTSAGSDLIDQRQGLVQQLAQIANVQQIGEGENYQLTIGNDTPLVLGATAYSLTTAPAANGNTDIFSGQTDITPDITSGSIGAQLAVRDDYIPSYLNSVNQLAYNIVQQVNAVHTTGYNANGTTDVPFFNPLSSTADAASQIALSSQVAADPANIATSSQSSSGDNLIATQLGDLLFQPVFSGGSVTSEYGDIVYSVGADASNANTDSSEQDSLAAQLQSEQQSVSGVSIDEETTQMLQFQRAYQASARMMNTIDTLTQTLLGLGTSTS